MNASVSTSKNLNTDARSTSIQVGVNTKYSNLNARVSDTSYGRSGSVSGSGSIVYMPYRGAAIASSSLPNTLALVEVGDLSGVGFLESGSITNTYGMTAVPLSSYYNNSLTINGSTLSNDVELKDYTKELFPSDNAIIYVPFDFLLVKRYILQVRNTEGEFLDSGLWAYDSKGNPLGFINRNGLLVISVVNDIEELIVGECKIDKHYLVVSPSIQEVVCE
ncbi:Kappa-fimbriae usher protein [Vibrio astriarenae]|nr:Kappa-fimbriae usher protein [Vibrio sp. C7]